MNERNAGVGWDNKKEEKAMDEPRGRRYIASECSKVLINGMVTDEQTTMQINVWLCAITKLFSIYWRVGKGRVQLHCAASVPQFGV